METALYGWLQTCYPRTLERARKGIMQGLSNLEKNSGAGDLSRHTKELQHALVLLDDSDSFDSFFEKICLLHEE